MVIHLDTKTDYECFIVKLLLDRPKWTLDDIHVYDYLAANKLNKDTNKKIIDEFNKVLDRMREDRIRSSKPRPNRTLLEICCRCKEEGTRLRLDDKVAYCENCILTMDKQERNKNYNKPMATFKFCHLCSKDILPLENKTSDEPDWHKECGGKYFCRGCKFRCSASNYSLDTKRCLNCKEKFEEGYIEIQRKEGLEKEALRKLNISSNDSEQLYWPELVHESIEEYKTISDPGMIEDWKIRYNKTKEYLNNIFCARCGLISQEKKSKQDQELRFCLDCTYSLDYRTRDNEKKLGPIYRFCGGCGKIDNSKELSEKERLSYEENRCYDCMTSCFNCKKLIRDSWYNGYEFRCDDCICQENRSTAGYVFKEENGSSSWSSHVKTTYTVPYSLKWEVDKKE